MLDPETLGEGLRMLRHRSRYSRDQLAADAGVSAGAISNYENDVSTPSAPTLRRIAMALAGSLELDLSELWEEIGVLLDSPKGTRMIDSSGLNPRTWGTAASSSSGD